MITTTPPNLWRESIFDLFINYISSGDFTGDRLLEDGEIRTRKAFRPKQQDSVLEGDEGKSRYC